MRIALGGITHEANSFCPQAATLADFEGRQLARGDEILTNWRATRTEQAGALSVLTEIPDCEIVPMMLARALSASPIVAADFHELLDELIERIEAALPLDGVVLVLHGAMMVQGEPDGTGEVLRRVRAVVGPGVPVVGTLDLHANVTPRMVREATALIGYHTAPHIDMYEAGHKAAQVLVGAIRGEMRPTATVARLPMIVPPEESTHTTGPLSEVIGRALALEEAGEIVHGGVYPVQPWMDNPDLASSIVIITDDDMAKAERLAAELGAMLWARRAAFEPELVPPDEAVRRALARESGTVILCDSADATSSGSTGDSTAILGAVLRALPLGEMALLNIVDAPVVAQAIAAGVGATIAIEVGAKLAPNYFSPVTFDAYVKSISDGTFVFKGPGMRGVPHHMGRAVVLTAGGPLAKLRLVVMERGVSQWDPELYRSLGLEPTDARIVQVKSPRAFRAGYEGIFDEVIVVEAPGAASPKLTALPWRDLGRPIYPLDPDVQWP